MKKSLILSLVTASTLFASNVTLDRFTQDNQFGTHDGFRSFTTSGFNFMKGSAKDWNINETLIYSVIEPLDIFVDGNFNWHKAGGVSDSEFNHINIGATYKFQPMDQLLLAGTYKALVMERHDNGQGGTKTSSLKQHELRLDARYFATSELAVGAYFAYNINTHSGAKDDMTLGANGSYKITDMFTIDAGLNDHIVKGYKIDGSSKWLNNMELNLGTTISFAENMKLAVGSGIGLADGDNVKGQVNASFWINF